MSVVNIDVLFEFLAYCENYSVSFRTEEESFWLHFTATIWAPRPNTFLRWYAHFMPMGYSLNDAHAISVSCI